MKIKNILTIVALTALVASVTGCGKTASDTSEAVSTETAQAEETKADAEEASIEEATTQEAKAEETKDLYDEIIERGVIRVGTEGTYAPNTYHDENDNLVGFDVEVAAVIAKNIGVEVEYVETEWSSIFASLDAGTIDIVVNEVGYNEERAEKYDFSKPYSFVQKAILVRGDNEDIASLDDIAGKVAANESTSLLGALALEKGAELDPVNEMAQSISEVLNGRADLTLNYLTAFNDYVNQHPEEDVKVITVGDPEPTSYVPVVKGNDKLVAAIDEALANAKESGELAEISIKYYGIDVTSEK